MWYSSFKPLSDKYGRRRSLLIVSTLYTVSALACALAPGVWLIIPARIVQGIGAGAITSSALVIVKDCYNGAAKTRIIALMQSMGGLAPMLAPILGAMVGTTVRPFSTDLLLDQQQGDTGSASALINFACTLFGCFGMTVISASPWNLILTLGDIILGASLAQFLFWRLLMKSYPLYRIQ